MHKSPFTKKNRKRSAKEQKANNSSKTLLIELAKQYPFRLALNIVLGFSGALFNGISTALIVPILLSILGQDAILREGPPFIRFILSPFEQFNEGARLAIMAGVVILCVFFKNITTYATNLSNNSLNRSMTSKLQLQGLRIILNVDVSFFDRNKLGDLMSCLGGEIARAVSIIKSITNLITLFVTVLVFVSLLLLISWQLTIAATVLFPLSTLISQGLIAESRKLGKRITLLNQQYSGGLIELFSGIRLVKSVGNEEAEFKRLQSLIREREGVSFKMQMNTAAFGPINEVVNIVVLFLLVIIGRILFANQLDSLSTILLTYLVVLNRLLPQIGQLNSSRSQIAKATASLDLVYDLLRLDNKPFMKDGTFEFKGLCHSIEFDDVSFSYPGSDVKVLRNVSLSLPKGTTLALVGSSGAGKSTLADLLPRFYDPTAGTIKIDGIDLREYSLNSVRRSMGIVSQDTFLFNESVRNNVSYGHPDKSDEEIINALKLANAYEFVQRLPKGLDTQLGDRGILLSGGQRQRLAIARALLQNPQILILDEATSALDTVSEQLVQKALDQLSQERTVLVIAHRLSTVRKADQIAVLEEGRVVEVGNHETLLAAGGAYSKLYKIQFQSTQEDKLSKEPSSQSTLEQLSYQLRTHLNSIIGSVSLIANDFDDPSSEQRELINEAFQSISSLLKYLELIENKRESTTF